MSTAKAVPAHIKIIMNTPLKDRSSEENQMLHDYHLGKGDYAPGSKFGNNVAVLPKQKSWLKEPETPWKGKKTGAKWNTYVRCFESHPALPLILKDGTERLVYGGSCSKPGMDADIFVGLDYSMKDHAQRFPWTPGYSIHYEITDGSIPKNLAEFRILVEWLAVQIEAGQKVHIGCIGGHGRTGTVLAALVAHMTDVENPIQYVRDNYCKKAVESKVQVDMLVKEYGCKEVVGSKAHYGYSKGGSTGGHSTTNEVTPVQASHCLWPEWKVEQ